MNDLIRVHLTEIAKRCAEIERLLSLKRKGPKNYSSGSHAPYYSMKWARWSKRFFEQMNEVDVMVIRRESYRGTSGTMVVRLRHALDYLCDHMDPDGSYQALRSVLNIKARLDGVRLVLRSQDGGLTAP